MPPLPLFAGNWIFAFVSIGGHIRISFRLSKCSYLSVPLPILRYNANLVLLLDLVLLPFCFPWMISQTKSFESLLNHGCHATGLVDGYIYTKCVCSQSWHQENLMNTLHNCIYMFLSTCNHVFSIPFKSHHDLHPHQKERGRPSICRLRHQVIKVKTKVNFFMRNNADDMMMDTQLSVIISLCAEKAWSAKLKELSCFNSL